MQSVMQIVARLRDDRIFAAGYHNIRLASTRVGTDNGAEFVIECR